MITLRDITEAYLSASKEDKIRFVNAIIPELIESPIFDSNEFKNAVDTAIILSDNKILPRLRSVEKVTGNYSFEEWEEHAPTIPEKITEIEDMIEQMLEMDIQGYVPAPIQEDSEVFIPETKIQKAAVELIKYACTLQAKDGIKAITPKLLHQFRKHILPEELRPKTVNPRQWKKEISDIVCDLAPVEKDKKGNNRGIRLVFPKNFNVGMLKCKLNVS